VPERAEFDSPLSHFFDIRARLQSPDEVSNRQSPDEGSNVGSSTYGLARLQPPR